MVFSGDNLRKKKKGQRKKILLGIIFLLVLFTFGMDRIITIIHQKRQISILKQRIEEVKQKNETLRKEIAALKTNPSRIEGEARQMGMTRPGEKKVKFVSEEEIEK